MTHSEVFSSRSIASHFSSSLSLLSITCSRNASNNDFKLSFQNLTPTFSLGIMETFNDGWHQYEHRHSGFFSVTVGNFDKFFSDEPFVYDFLEAKETIHFELSFKYPTAKEGDSSKEIEKKKKRKKHSDGKSIIFNLKVSQQEQAPLPVMFTISFLNSKNEKKFRKNYFSIFSARFPKKQFIVYSRTISYDRDIFHGPLSQAVGNGNLILSCEFKVLKLVNASVLNVARKLSFDYGQLLETEELTDAVFIVGGNQILAHKNILSARSPFLANMFAEQDAEQYEIADIDEGTFKELLRYIYTGKVENRYLLGLFELAGQYQLPSLKVKCEEHFLNRDSSVTYANVCQLLNLADRYECLALKQKCIDYIDDHMAQVNITEGWRTWIVSQAHLAAEFPYNFTKLEQKQ